MRNSRFDGFEKELCLDVFLTETFDAIVLKVR